MRPISWYILPILSAFPLREPIDSDDFTWSGILANIDVPDGLPGLPIASPSKVNPDYYYHWIRDGALTINAVINEWQVTNDAKLEQIINNYIESSHKLQAVPNLSGGLGEPKFHVDGKAFNQPWGRPQNDGPALRSLVIAKYAQDSPNLASIYQHVLLPDLQYVASQWQTPSFDLWEELYGYHFFTSLMQYASLKAGSVIAGKLGLKDDSLKYALASKQVSRFIDQYFLSYQTTQGAICEHYPCNNGGRTGMDAATVIATTDIEDLAGWTVNYDKQPLHITCHDIRVKNTIDALIEDSRTRYPINYNEPGGIGRYPEDIYNGYGESLGNPWFITTNAVIEALSRTGQYERATPHYNFLVAHGSSSLSEQISRYTGYMQGAENLTWSYTSTRKAKQAYEKGISYRRMQEQVL